MKHTVLIDTNVWVSALINPFGLPAMIKKAWVEHRFNVVVSPFMLEELAEVLIRPRIHVLRKSII
ncbi:MAG TPA: putative toxin-antitoxin system toxin component, PIN family [Candidatus Brocadiia bacterium]|nr:putative toxin-antitoxin system toxin component, PIN family [Planctomycetota bacterium]MDO8092274.1 putative toxin-antitoxin system toxin component, PIN family [Candidatus Brocadiales bacterium]